MSNKELAKIKMKQVEDYRQSGLTAREWCRQNKISLSNLRYWINKINRMSRPIDNEASGFIELTRETPQNSGISILLGPYTINISSGFDEELLLKVTGILRSL